MKQTSDSKSGDSLLKYIKFYCISFSIRLPKGFINLLTCELILPKNESENAVCLPIKSVCMNDFWIFQCQSSAFVVGSEVTLIGVLLFSLNIRAEKHLVRQDAIELH